jgi:hypothetical protein
MKTAAMASICLVCLLIFPIIFLLPLDSHIAGFMASLAFALSVLLSIGFLFIPKAMVLLSSDYDDDALRMRMFSRKKKIDILPRWTTVAGGGGGGEEVGRGGGRGGGGKGMDRSDRGRANVTAVNGYFPVFLSRFHQQITPAVSRNFSRSRSRGKNGDGNGVANGGADGSNGGISGAGGGGGGGSGKVRVLSRKSQQGTKAVGFALSSLTRRSDGLGLGGAGGLIGIGQRGGGGGAVDGVIEEGDENAEENENENINEDGDNYLGQSKRLLSVAEFYKTKDLDTRMMVSNSKWP